MSIVTDYKVPLAIDKGLSTYDETTVTQDPNLVADGDSVAQVSGQGDTTSQFLKELEEIEKQMIALNANDANQALAPGN